jgi:Transglycosylase SLT domain
MYYLRAVALALLPCVFLVSPGLAGKRKRSTPPPATPAVSPLDRVAFAVDGAESSHGTDEAMWRLDLAGPEGPMQVSAAAASDVGGGDRFDFDQNREIGRAYLAQLYRRYGNWPDTVAAYNWGIGNLNSWVKAGRPAAGLVPGVGVYLSRVMHDSGLCQPAATAAISRGPRKPPPAPSCEDLAGWSGMIGDGRSSTSAGATPFYTELDRAMRLALEHAGSRQR